MTDLWFPVHTNLRSRPIVVRACDALNIKPHTAMGLLVQFWGTCSLHLDDGNIREHSDNQLEEWAGWTGKRGAFATFIRTHHTDPDGRISEWDDFAGKLKASRKQARDRARTSRERSRTEAVTEHERHANVHQQSKIRIETTKEPPPAAREIDPLRDAEADLRARLASDADRSALSALLNAVQNPLRWIMELRGCLDGMAGHVHVTPIQLGIALRDYSANGLANPGPQHFRAYLQRAAKAPSDPLPIAKRLGGARNDAAIDNWLKEGA